MQKNKKKTKAVEFAYIFNPDEAAHHEHLDLHCLPSKSVNYQYDTAWAIFFFNFAEVNFDFSFFFLALKKFKASGNNIEIV